MKRLILSSCFLSLVLMTNSNYLESQNLSYPIVETNVSAYYSDVAIISEPTDGSEFYGQDANYTGNLPTYTNNGDGTILDNVTGLIWQQEMGEKISYSDAVDKAGSMTLGGYNDWRIPTIKELYSLILFSGRLQGMTIYEKFIDTLYFDQPYGDIASGERIIDAQTWTSTHYRSTTMQGDSTIFGVNFLDGRIKGYPKFKPGSNNTNPNIMYFRMVRGNQEYGKNNYVDNEDGTVSDLATGLMWQKSDDGNNRDWKEALQYAEGLELSAYDDWRLPNAKELQSIVDYTRCPDVTHSAAIDPIFECTEITDPEGNSGQYPYFWSGTTHLDGPNPYSGAVYLAFGEAQGKMNNQLLDVHGAGAQRSDPKSGNAEDYPEYHGPQGDLRYVYNYVRCVRNFDISNSDKLLNNQSQIKIFPNPTENQLNIEFNKRQDTVNGFIYDIRGRKVHSFNDNDVDRTELCLESLDAGLYYISVETEDKIYNQEIIKH